MQGKIRKNLGDKFLILYKIERAGFGGLTNRLLLLIKENLKKKLIDSLKSKEAVADILSKVIAFLMNKLLTLLLF
jgi:hypothetical protein